MKTALAVCLVSLASVSGAAGWPSAVQPPHPKTLLAIPGSVVAFAQDEDHIVWANGNARCGRVVQIKSLSTGATRFLDSRGGPLCEELEYAFLDEMKLAGTRALWTTAEETFSQVYFTLFTSAPSDKSERRLGDLSIDLDNPLLRPVPMAGDGRTLLFTRIPTFAGETDDIRRSGVYRVDGRTALYTSGTEWALDVSTEGARFALARQIPSGCVCNSQPEWSPDGTRIAFVSERAEGERSQLFTMNADGGDLHLLMEDVTGFAWAPDGTTLAAANWRAGTLAIVRPDGSAIRTLHPDPAGNPVLNYAFAWSPDGRLLAYATRVGQEWHLQVVRATGGAAIDLGTIYEFTVAWAPDGQHLAYVRLRNEVRHVYVVPVAGDAPLELGAGDAPSWSPDGSSIVLQRPDGIYIVARDGSQARRIVASSPDTAVEHAWSPDGGWIAFARSRQASGSDDGVWIVRPGGGSLRRLSPDGHAPVWSPRSDVIAIQGSGRVTLVDIETNALRSLSPGFSPAWSPSGNRLAYVAGDFPPSPSEIAVVDTAGSRLTLTSTTPAPKRLVVETRTRDGKLLTTFNSSPRLAGIAFSGSRVALVIDQSNPRPEPLRGARARVEVRTTKGRLLRAVLVPRPVWGHLAMSGRWLVFSTWASSRGGGMQAARALDVLTGRTTILARARVITGLSIDGRRVAWAEPGGQNSRIRAVVLPP